MNFRLIAIAAACGLCGLAAQAFQGELNPLPPPPFKSTLDRSQVQAGARQPMQITNGGTGVEVNNGKADRATVRAGARAIAAEGAATYGDTND
jgi:hypothetical protein